MAKNWRDEFDDRQRKQIAWAEKYTNETDPDGKPLWKHGANGHNDLVIIGTMAALLDKVQRMIPADAHLFAVSPNASVQEWDQALRQLNEIAPFKLERVRRDTPESE